jgi:hypothetical protein
MLEKRCRAFILSYSVGMFEVRNSPLTRKGVFSLPPFCDSTLVLVAVLTLLYSPGADKTDGMGFAVTVLYCQSCLLTVVLRTIKRTTI